MLLQLKITTYNNLSTSKITTSTVSINIIKNPNNPIFTLPAYKITIPKTQSLNSTIVNITTTNQNKIKPLP